MASGTGRYESHSWVTVTPCEKIQSSTDFKPVNETETKHSKCFLLVNRDLLWPKAHRQLSTGCWIYHQCWSKSELSRFPVISEECWSQCQWSYGLLGSFRGRTGALQRWAPSCRRGKEQQVWALGVWTGTKFWRTGGNLVTRFGEVHTSTQAEHKKLVGLPSVQWVWH